jgi:uncharacterized protein (DUF4415 family)
MKESADTKQYSLETLKAERARAKPRAQANAPAQPVDEEFWQTARVVMPPANKTSIHLRLDADVLKWFREQGRGHLSRMNAVLRSYMDAKRQ